MSSEDLNLNQIVNNICSFQRLPRSFLLPATIFFLPCYDVIQGEYCIVTVNSLNKSRPKPATNMERELSGIVVHSARVHQTEDISARSVLQTFLTGRRTDSSVGQSGCHHCRRLARRLQGTQLEVKVQSVPHRSVFFETLNLFLNR